MITVAVTRTVRPGSEAAFEVALHDFLQRSLKAEGQLGVHVLRPAPESGSREYGILRRFENEAALERFYASAPFLDYEATVAPLTDGPPRRERVSGLEAWFTSPGRPIIPPPRWKMASITFLAVFPVSQVLSRALGPVIGAWPPWAASLAMSAAMVTALTWFAMPVLARLFRPWLQVKRGTPI